MNCVNCSHTILVTPSGQLIHSRNQESQCIGLPSFAYPREPECTHCGTRIYPGPSNWRHIGTGIWCDGRSLPPTVGAQRATVERDYERFHALLNNASLWWMRDGRRVPLPHRPTTESSRFGTPTPRVYDTYFVDSSGNRVPVHNPSPGPTPNIGRGAPREPYFSMDPPQTVANLQEVARAVGESGLLGSPVQDAGTAAGSSRGNERLRQLLTQPSVIELAQGFTTPSDGIMEDEEGLPEGFTVIDPHNLLITAIARLSVDVPNLEDDCNEFINQLEDTNSDFKHAVFEYNTAKDEYTKTAPETTRRIKSR